MAQFSTLTDRWLGIKLIYGSQSTGDGDKDGHSGGGIMLLYSLSNVARDLRSTLRCRQSVHSLRRPLSDSVRREIPISVRSGV